MHELGLVILDGPGRSLGYITIPRLTFIGPPLALFSLGYLMASPLDGSSGTTRLCREIKLRVHEKTAIATLLIDVWGAGEEPASSSRAEHSNLELNRDIFWLSPLSNQGLVDSELPVAGIVRGPVSGVPSSVRQDGSVAFLSMSTRSAAALGKTLMMFATDVGAEAIKFEQNYDSGGVGRKSYEIECLKLDSFAAESLLLVKQH